MRKLRNIGFFLLLIALGLEVLVFAPETVNLPRPIKANGAEVLTRNAPEQTMVGVQAVGTKDGIKEWELWSEKTSGSRDRGSWVLEKVKVHVFGRDRLSYTVTGDRGTIAGNQRDLEIAGHVVTRSSNGYIFTTDHITYESSTRTLHGTGPVHLQTENDHINANHLDLTGVEIFAYLGDERITISHHVHAIKGVSATDTIKIKSESALLSAKDASASFHTDVVVEMGDARITGPQAQFVFDQNSKQVKSLVVEGGIRLSDLDRWATAQRIDMLFKEDKFILSGSPRVVQNSDELFGDQIVYSNKGKDIFVNDVKARFEDDSKDSKDRDSKDKDSKEKLIK